MDTLRAALLLAALGLTTTARAGEPPGTTDHELLLHGWRSPSIGVEYRRGFLGVHAGAYPTIISRNAHGDFETTWFAKAGLTGYFLPLRLTSERPSLAFVSVAYLRGLNHGWDDAFFVEAGFRWAVWKGLDLRLGAGLLLAPGHSPRCHCHRARWPRPPWPRSDSGACGLSPLASSSCVTGRGPPPPGRMLHSAHRRTSRRAAPRASHFPARQRNCGRSPRHPPGCSTSGPVHFRRQRGFHASPYAARSARPHRVRLQGRDGQGGNGHRGGQGRGGDEGGR